MMTEKKALLKTLFETGKIPTGENFAEFIDETYNNYMLVDMFNPGIPPSEFRTGESILVFNYDPDNNPDWLTLFGAEVSAGEVMVRTLHYPTEGVTIQEFDTNRNGRYYANKSRLNVKGQDAWGPIQDHPEVLTVNGERPDENGNIQVSTTGSLRKPEVTYSYHVPAEGSDWTYEFDIELPDYNPDTDVLEYFRGATRMDAGNVEIVAYNNPTLSLRLLNGWNISYGYPMEIWRYKYGTGGSAPTPSVPTITNHKFYLEVPSGNTNPEVIVPGIKEGNYTYFVGINDGTVRANAYEVEVDEEREAFIIKLTTTSMSRYTIIISVFS